MIPARCCNCSFCSRFNGTWTSHPAASLRLEESAEHPPCRYRFGTRTADFLFCSRCGVVVAAVCDIEGRCHAVVNINTMNDVTAGQLDLSSSDFSQETLPQRLDRRSRRWIGRVEINRR